MILIKQKPTYIRTKDGRIAEVKENMVVKVCDDATRLVYKEEPYNCVLNGYDDILNQAYTIEELCDEFVIDCKTHYVVYHDLEWAKSKAQRFNGKFIIYGAIWTEWGLKYVAKMNEKGELELL